MEAHDKKVYSPESITALARAIAKDQEAFEWLMANDEKELGALVDVLVVGKEDALQWLRTYGFKNIALFVDALDEIEGAVDRLVANNGKAWAATAQSFNGNDSADAFLQQYFPHYFQLVRVLIRRYDGMTSALGGFNGRGSRGAYFNRF